MQRCSAAGDTDDEATARSQRADGPAMAHLHGRAAAHILDVGIGAIFNLGVTWLQHLVFGVRLHRRHVVIMVDKKVPKTLAEGSSDLPAWGYSSS